MIRVNIRRIKNQNGLTKTYESTKAPDLAEVDLKEPFYTRLKFTNASSRIIVNGFIKVTMLLDCVRCLEPFSYTGEVEFYEEFLPVDSPELKDEDTLEWEDLSRFTYENDEIDIYEMLRQNILTAIPSKPLCKDACRGICPICGADLNREECSCSDEEIDPRLLPLLKFKNQKGNE